MVSAVRGLFPITSKTGALTVLVAVCLLLFLVSLLFDLNPLIVFGGAAGAATFLILTYRLPECFLVGVVFIPQLKAYWPLKSIDQIVDLTGVMLAGLAIGLALRLVRRKGETGSGDSERSSSRLRIAVFLYFVFAATVAASYLHTSAPVYGGLKLARLLTIGTMLFLSSFLLIRDHDDLRRIAGLFVLCGLITSLQILTHLESQNPAASGTEDITRIGAGWVMGMTFVLLMYFRFLKNETLH
ncbi:MAG: hypothetical protein ACRD4Y_11445, partial [Candidatus Acidiferrales bacterium]